MSFNAYSPSPLMGEGWGGGETSMRRRLIPLPLPPPTEGGRVKGVDFLSSAEKDTRRLIS